MRQIDTQAPLPGGLAAGADSPVRQYLSFRLGGLEYGIALERVQELRPLRALERIANHGVIVNGVVMSRGVIMPLVDMRIAFGGRGGPDGARTDVIILQLSSCVMGMVVDGVTDIVALSDAAIAPVPGVAAHADYLLGLGNVGGRQLIVLDIDKLMSIRKGGADATPPAPPAVRAVPATAPRAAPDPS